MSVHQTVRKFILKVLQPNDVPLALSLSLATCVFLSLSKCLPRAGGLSTISSIQGLQLTKPPFIAAQWRLCTSLCLACYPVSPVFWQSADRPASSFPPLRSLYTLPSDGNIVSTGSSAWRRMGTLFSVLPAIYLTHSWLLGVGGLRCF